jgi:Fe-S-cluster containining protein
MSKRPSRSSLAKTLSVAAGDYQNEHIIPHCPQCAQPCCKLEALVLELDWKELKAIWQIKEPHKEFDKRLASGQGPQEIRPANGLYYAHKKVCPAYDPGQGCRVYNQDVKPPGCSDFPVYEDGGEVVADLRCEAVNLEALADWLARAAGQGSRVSQSADEQFPFLVTLSVKSPAVETKPARGMGKGAKLRR